MKNPITPKDKDYSQWYLDVIREADLAEHAPVRGCMVIKPNGYAIWESIQAELDKKIKETGHKNVYFPLFVPKSVMNKEADHVKGFAKECAVVTHYRLIDSEDGVIVDPQAKLEEEVIVRPTSEAIMYETFSKWVHSYRDLPILVNQWANVVRWEMRTRLFLRTTEFLWQEGHTVHETHQEAIDEALKMLDVYKEVVEDHLAIYVIPGLKSKMERFPGAHNTYTLEALMQDLKALQSATSHDLGDNFAKAFDIKFTDAQGELKYAWQTSWGFSTRVIGALIMEHSDDKGLVLPPKVAPVQVVVIPIFKEDEKDNVLNYANEIFAQLKNAGIRAEVDERDYVSPGQKFNEWERRGVPVRLEVGPKEAKEKTVTAAQRIQNEKSSFELDETSHKVSEILESMQKQLFENSKRLVEQNTHFVENYAEFKEVLEQKGGFIKAVWCENEECELAIKDETKATTRCKPLSGEKVEGGKCIYCNKPAEDVWYFAKAY